MEILNAAKSLLSAVRAAISTPPQASEPTGAQAIVSGELREPAHVAAAEASVAPPVHAPDLADACAAARLATRERARAIIMAPQAAGRRTLAMHLGLESDVPVRQALAILATTVPEASAGGSGGDLSPLERHMQRVRAFQPATPAGAVTPIANIDAGEIFERRAREARRPASKGAGGENDEQS